MAAGKPIAALSGNTGTCCCPCRVGFGGRHPPTRSTGSFSFRVLVLSLQSQTRTGTASSERQLQGKTITGQDISFWKVTHSRSSHPNCWPLEGWLIAKRLDFRVGGVNGHYLLMKSDEVAICPFQSTTPGEISSGHPRTMFRREI